MVLMNVELAKLRRQTLKTQEEFAREAKIALSTLQLAEKGNNVALSTQKKIIETLTVLLGRTITVNDIDEFKGSVE